MQHYYAWVKGPQSRRAVENARLLKLIRASFNASNGIYEETIAAIREYVAIFVDSNLAGQGLRLRCDHSVRYS
jgi:hypothetical protein